MALTNSTMFLATIPGFDEAQQCRLGTVDSEDEDRFGFYERETYASVSEGSRS